MSETGLRCPDSQDLGFYSLECRNITNRKSPSSNIHGFTFRFTVVVFLSLSTFGPSGCVLQGAGDAARERGQTPSHTNSSSAFLRLASFSLVWQSNRIHGRRRRTKKTWSACVVRLCLIAAGSCFIFPPVFFSDCLAQNHMSFISVLLMAVTCRLSAIVTSHEAAARA